MKENLDEKYLLVNYVSGERAVWDGGIILFNSPEEATSHNDIFKNQYGLCQFSIIPVKLYSHSNILRHHKWVNYEDIINTDKYNTFKYHPDVFSSTPPFLLIIDGHILCWEYDDTILFNTDEEINEFIDRLNIRQSKAIDCRGVSLLAECIYYKDIANTRNFEALIKEFNDWSWEE